MWPIHDRSASSCHHVVAVMAMDQESPSPDGSYRPVHRMTLAGKGQKTAYLIEESANEMEENMTGLVHGWQQLQFRDNRPSQPHE